MNRHGPIFAKAYLGPLIHSESAREAYDTLVAGGIAEVEPLDGITGCSDDSGASLDVVVSHTRLVPRKNLRVLFFHTIRVEGRREGAVSDMGELHGLRQSDRIPPTAEIPADVVVVVRGTDL